MAFDIEEEGVVQEQEKHLDEQDVGEGGAQGIIGVSAVEREGTLVVVEVLIASALLVASAILAHVRCSDVMI